MASTFKIDREHLKPLPVGKSDWASHPPWVISFLRRVPLPVLLVLSLSAPAATKYWRGGTSSSAQAAANWSDSAASGADVSSAAPVTGDAIVLDGIDDAAQRAMTWDLDDVAPASWTQDGYTNVVTFKTGRNGYNVNSTLYRANGVLADDGTNRILSVSGAVSLLSGTWTHTANPAFYNYQHTKSALMQSYVSNTNGLGVYRLLVKTGGAFTLGANAKIDVSKRGYASGNGPGYPQLYDDNNRQGACHAGSGARGAIPTARSATPTRSARAAAARAAARLSSSLPRPSRLTDASRRTPRPPRIGIPGRAGASASSRRRSPGRRRRVSRRTAERRRAARAAAADASRCGSREAEISTDSSGRCGRRGARSRAAATAARAARSTESLPQTGSAAAN